ncbi:NADH-quinone oxidoreductase subunit B family protein [Thermococcus sp. LS2]|uniref:NADH-quinone oxidoreductase subunit B family protein n=1 Tax=Thermococcus sp. LS2 TaxID=1638260 RepID=UPI00143B40F4|nr:NADH-quinone oxidoreductase subunit B family protein [Thermococcus sp. LS2]NJE11520.1 hydrogenase [Thermococcus sp. LS2]
MKPKLRSVWVFHLDTGACNGCDIEILDLLTPFYDAERFGVKLIGSPRHAHAMLVTGPLTRQCYYAAKKAIKAMPPEPRIIVAVGTCACSGGIFYNGYPIYRRPESGREGKEYPRRGGIEELIADLKDQGEKVGPVIYIPGCPPRPEEILYGIAQLLGVVEKKMKEEHYIEETAPFMLQEYPIEERVRLTLRERLRYVVGYFDREKILDDFIKLVERAKKSENPREVLRELINDYCAKEKDHRIAFCMRFLESEYWKVKEEYEALSSNKTVVYGI